MFKNISSFKPASLAICRWVLLACLSLLLSFAISAVFVVYFSHKVDHLALRWVLGGCGVLLLFGAGMLVWMNGQLQESQRSLQSLIGNLPGMAYRCRNDADWTMEFVSDGCEALTGCPAGYLQGKTGAAFNNFIHPDDQAQVKAEIAAALAAQQSFRLTYRMKHWSGAWRWVWDQGHCVEWSATGEPLMLEGLIMDITAQVDIQQELQQAKEQADAATRAKSIFLANIREPLKTPCPPYKCEKIPI